MRYPTGPLGLALRLSGLYRASAPAIEAFPPPPRHTIDMAPTIDYRKRTGQSKGFSLRKPTATPMPSGVRQFKQARQAETKSVQKKPDSTACYSVLNDQQTMAPKEAPKQVIDRDAM